MESVILEVIIHNSADKVVRIINAGPFNEIHDQLFMDLTETHWPLTKIPADLTEFSKLKKFASMEMLLAKMNIEHLKQLDSEERKRYLQTNVAPCSMMSPFIAAAFKHTLPPFYAVF